MLEYQAVTDLTEVYKMDFEMFQYSPEGYY